MATIIFGRVVVAAVLAVVLLVPSRAIAVAAGHTSVVGTASPVQAVTTLVRPFTNSHYNNAACNAVKGKLTVCPLTSRLRKQWAREHAYEKSHPSGGYGNMFCRCQNTPEFIRISLSSKTPRSARVNVRWNFGAMSYSTVFVTVPRHGRWLVDDQYCASNPKSTLYKMPVGPCP